MSMRQNPHPPKSTRFPPFSCYATHMKKGARKLRPAPKKGTRFALSSALDLRFPLPPAPQHVSSGSFATAAWVLKAPMAHFGKGVHFLRWDFAKERDVAQVCEQHRGWIVQQMVHSMTAFRGGSTFSFRVLALVVSASPLKVVWSKSFPPAHPPRCAQVVTGVIDLITQKKWRTATPAPAAAAQTAPDSPAAADVSPISREVSEAPHAMAEYQGVLPGFSLTQSHVDLLERMFTTAGGVHAADPPLCEWLGTVFAEAAAARGQVRTASAPASDGLGTGSLPSKQPTSAI